MTPRTNRRELGRTGRAGCPRERITSRIVAVMSLLTFSVADAASQSRGQTAPGRGRGVVAPVSYDGLWNGTTNQGDSISFTVDGGRITRLAIAAQFAGANCSSRSSTTVNTNALITNAMATVRSAGGLDFVAEILFESAVTASGSAGLRATAPVGPPPGFPGHVPSCPSTVGVVWTATRSDASAAQLAAAATSLEARVCSAAPRQATPAVVAAEDPDGVTPPLSGTTRFYLHLDSGSKTSGSLSTSDGGNSVNTRERTAWFRRKLVGDMEGTKYRFGIRTNQIDTTSPPPELQLEVLHERGGVTTVLASATVSPDRRSSRRQIVEVTGPDPATFSGDDLVVRTTWMKGIGYVWAFQSWVDVPLTQLDPTELDLRFHVWELSGRVMDATGRPLPNAAVLFSTHDDSGHAVRTYYADAFAGTILPAGMLNPRTTTDARGRFTLAVRRGVFPSAARSFAGEVVVVNACRRLDTRARGPAVTVHLDPTRTTVDVGTLSVKR